VEKHTILLQQFANCKCKKFSNVVTRWQFHRPDVGDSRRSFGFWFRLFPVGDFRRGDHRRRLDGAGAGAGRPLRQLVHRQRRRGASGKRRRWVAQNVGPRERRQLFLRPLLLVPPNVVDDFGVRRQQLQDGRQQSGVLLGPNVIKLFANVRNKQECLSLAGLSWLVCVCG
jgi:hypothetical protein